VYKLLLN